MCVRVCVACMCVFYVLCAVLDINEDDDDDYDYYFFLTLGIYNPEGV